MSKHSVRPLQHEDIPQLVHYWMSADKAFLEGMGVDLHKMPAEADWTAMLLDQLSKAIPDKPSFCMIWLLDGEAVGHSNINKIVFAQEAYMHLHIWKPEARRSGHGLAFVRMTLPWFFDQYQLQNLFCEPYALNPGPNKTLGKAGFEFVKTHLTVPGWINFEQEVNRWQLSRQRFTIVRFSGAFVNGAGLGNLLVVIRRNSIGRATIGRQGYLRKQAG